MLFIWCTFYSSPQHQMFSSEWCLKKDSQLFYIKLLRSQTRLLCLNKAFHIQALEQHSVWSSRQGWPTSPTPLPHTFTALPFSTSFLQYTHVRPHTNAHTSIQKRPRLPVDTATKGPVSRLVMLTLNLLCLHFLTYQGHLFISCHIG